MNFFVNSNGVLMESNIPAWKKLAIELENGTAEILKKRKEWAQKVNQKRVNSIKKAMKVKAEKAKKVCPCCGIDAR